MKARLSILHFAFYNAAQFVPVCGNQVLFFLAASHIDGDIVGVRDDQRAAALEAGDVVDFGICQLQDALYALCFLFLQIQNDFDFAVVQDAAAVFSIFQGKEVVQILRGNQNPAAVAASEYWRYAAFPGQRTKQCAGRPKSAFRGIDRGLPGHPDWHCRR